MRASLQVTGLRESMGALRALPGAMQEASREFASPEAAKEIEARARRTSAFADRSGRLRASIRRRGSRVQATAPYAASVEFGTRKRQTRSGANRGSVRARRFMLRAAMQARQPGARRFARELDRRGATIERRVRRATI